MADMRTVVVEDSLMTMVVGSSTMVEGSLTMMEGSSMMVEEHSLLVAVDGSFLVTVEDSLMADNSKAEVVNLDAEYDSMRSGLSPLLKNKKREL
jgi:hypothetical protein